MLASDSHSVFTSGCLPLFLLCDISALTSDSSHWESDPELPWTLISPGPALQKHELSGLKQLDTIADNKIVV